MVAASLVAVGAAVTFPSDCPGGRPRLCNALHSSGAQRGADLGVGRRRVVYEAACECGWRGADRSIQDEAADDAMGHMRPG